MPKQRSQTRPNSAIAGMLDDSILTDATKRVAPQIATPDVPDVPTQDQAAVPPAPSTPARTGEPADIQKQFRLTPSAYATLREMGDAFSNAIGFEVSNSSLFRVLLTAIKPSLPALKQCCEDHLTPVSQPSTAIGCEHLRDEIEVALAHTLLRALDAASRE
ncbi:MAG: hypothetical protein AAF288_13450 [Planctomycetota bacterium]